MAGTGSVFRAGWGWALEGDQNYKSIHDMCRMWMVLYAVDEHRQLDGEPRHKLFDMPMLEQAPRSCTA